MGGGDSSCGLLYNFRLLAFTCWASTLPSSVISVYLDFLASTDMIVWAP